MVTTKHLQKAAEILGAPIVKTEPLGGGCIAQTEKWHTADGQVVVAKTGGGQAMSFLMEANGLKELQKAEALRVPEVLYADEELLLLELIEEGPRRSDFFDYFGRALARMHRFTSKNFGFYEDNFIGATPQVNRPAGSEAEDWTEFYRNKRLRYQYELARKKGYVDRQFEVLFEQLDEGLSDLLRGSEEAPSLLHGDLWAGNYMRDTEGLPVLIDPAVYYGHREAELAMTKLFGGFDASFYQAYKEEWPLKPGYERREAVYTLYHVMNHLNLFGTGYLSHCLQLMRTALR